MNANRQSTSKKSTSNSKLTILYERLSVDDDNRTGDSNSIQNQKSMLEDYAKRHNFSNIVHMTDDGHSGTRFNRPSFTKMMDEVAMGNVAIVIVKDLSRLGRDHLRVGLYTDADVKHKLKKHEVTLLNFFRKYIKPLSLVKTGRRGGKPVSLFYCLLFRKILKLPMNFQVIIREHKDFIDKCVHDVFDCCGFAHYFFGDGNDFTPRRFIAPDLAE